MKAKPCPCCETPPCIHQDDDSGLWDVVHADIPRYWFQCGTPMVLNCESEAEAVEAWNMMMAKRKEATT